MSSIKKNQKWLLIERSDGKREVVNVRSLLNSAEVELSIGSVVTMAVCEGDDKSAKIIAAARESNQLEHLLHVTQNENDAKEEDDTAQEQREDGDFSGSDGSSWAPSRSSSTSDASETGENTSNIRQYYNKSGRVLTPCTRVNAIIPNVVPQKQAQYSNSKIKNKTPNHNAVHNTRVKNELNLSGTKISTNQIHAKHPDSDTNEELAIINNLFFKIFKILSDAKTQNSIPDVNFKSSYDCQDISNSTTIDLNRNQTANTINNIPVISIGNVMSIKQDQSTNQSVRGEESTMVEYTMSEDEYARSEDSNRSDDNVLISNKYATVNASNANESNLSNGKSKSSKTNSKSSKPDSTEAEWIPIGSGQTLVHKDQFKKVNWRSYTMATRTLLLAVFPRHILATHSLTGKKSPAFQNKPAKMCLDQRTIQDVLIEITDRFNIKENLVRTIITTKCADECKMMKIKKQKMKSLVDLKNQHRRTKTKAIMGRDANHTS